MDRPLRVAFVCIGLNGSQARTLLFSLQATATLLGVRLTAVLAGDGRTPASPARRLLEMLDSQNFDGMIFHTSALWLPTEFPTLRQFLEQVKPLRTVSLGVPLEGFDSVFLDQASAIQELVHHLYDVHGLRRFAWLEGKPDHVEAGLRRAAFFSALATKGIPPEKVLTFPGDFSRASGVAAVQALVPLMVEPLALCCTNDQAALGALDQARILGIRVPERLTVTGFDDIEQAALHEPSLTTVGQPFIHMADSALRLLVRQLTDPGPVLHEKLSSSMFYRDSCGCGTSATMSCHQKAELVSALLSGERNEVEGTQVFLKAWVVDHLTAFEYLLETGNSTVLRGLWGQYFNRLAGEYERGLSFPRLFSGLESLYGRHPSFAPASRENLILAGAAEAKKGSLSNRNLRGFFFALHRFEVLLGQINLREELQDLPLEPMVALGVHGMALVRFGAPPRTVYLKTIWTQGSSPPLGAPVDYPALLPPPLDTLDLPCSRVLAALITDGTYLGYVIFWTESQETFLCDFLSHQLAETLHRIELLEKIRDQRLELEATLEERKKMQHQLVETERVASLGRLVAGVAHEINTPLGTGITGTSFLLDRLVDIRTQLAQGTLPKATLEQFLDQGQEALEGTLRSLLKAGDLIQAFKGLGLDHGQGEWRPVILQTLFQDLGALYGGELARRDILFTCELPPQETTIYTQPSALVQVAGELIENAMVHAFGAEFRGEPEILLQVTLVGQHLHLAVTDNGVGLSADVRRHLFDPLFTTKRPEGHSGLGLHLAFQLVTRTLSGQMSVASEPGAGSCFLCVIPLPAS